MGTSVIDKYYQIGYLEEWNFIYLENSGSASRELYFHFSGCDDSQRKSIE